jgi:hypothetical protein
MIPKRAVCLLGTLAVLGPVTSSAAAESRASIALESGAVWTGYNNLRIPGAGGTRISFADELRTEAAPFARLFAEVRLGDRNRLALLVAPLRLDARGSVDRPVTFQDVTFPTGAPLTGLFRFDSYRLTWSNDVLRRGRLELSLGLTAKIRDAAVRLASATMRAEKTNTGFVPLLHFRARVRLSDRLAALVEGDAAAAPQGRAEDVLLAADYDLTRRVAVRAGVRLLEGGADNDEVYTFTWLNYAVLGAVVRF